MRWCDVRIPDSSSTGEQNTKADCKVFLLAESGKIEKVPKITMKCFDYLIYMKNWPISSTLLCRQLQRINGTSISNKVFVARVTDAISNDDIRQHFEQFGEVRCLSFSQTYFLPNLPSPFLDYGPLLSPSVARLRVRPIRRGESGQVLARKRSHDQGRVGAYWRGEAERSRSIEERFWRRKEHQRGRRWRRRLLWGSGEPRVLAEAPAGQAVRS